MSEEGMVVMQIVEVLSHTAQPLSVGVVIVTLISHIVFFGWPIAWYVSRPRVAA
jgi:S-adenosylmethionine/arginine decarboxylase-like enzyme